MAGTTTSYTPLTSKQIVKEALRQLVNNLVFVKNIDRRYDKEFKGERKIGDTITIRKPAKFIVREGKEVNLNDFSEKSVDVKIDRQLGVDISFASADLALNLDDFSRQYIKPAMATLANFIDAEGVKQYAKIFNTVGNGLTPQGLPASMDLDTFLNAGVLLDNNATPVDDQRGVVLNPRAQAKAVNALKGLFNSQTELKSQYEKGRMGTAAGFDFAMSQNIPMHTVGPLGGTPLVNGAAQTGSTLSTKGWTAAAARRLNKGDVFTIAGVKGVNPMGKQSTEELQQFVVLSDFNSDASGIGGVSISPAIVGPGSKDQTVSALPADNAVISVLGTAGQVTSVNLAYHPDAFVMVAVDLPLPKGVDMAERATAPSIGLSVRLVRQFDVKTDQWITRFDVLLGFETVYPEFAARIQG